MPSKPHMLASAAATVPIAVAVAATAKSQESAQFTVHVILSPASRHLFRPSMFPRSSSAACDPATLRPCDPGILRHMAMAPRAVAMGHGLGVVISVASPPSAEPIRSI
jgi:hypothetical protein